MPEPRSSSPLLRRLLYVAVAAGFGLGVWYFGFHAGPEEEGPPRPAWAGASGEGPPPAPVRVVIAQRQDMPVRIKAIGTVTPLNTVTVRPRVDGQLLRVVFEEGQHVEQGQLLAEIDPRVYEIRLAQARGQQKQNAAQLETAERDLERTRQLHERTLVTNQQMEAQEALVSEREGALAADQAAVDDARLQLAYTKIEAPISGRLGLRRVDAGNLIRAGDADGLVVITQTRPIAVTFTIPEIDLPKVLDPVRAGEVLAVEAWDRSEQTLLATGVLKTLDNQIDLATGTLRLKAEFSNEDERLFPNQFVNVRLRVRTLPDAVVIPSAAIEYGSRGTYVYVIDSEQKASVRNVVLGPSDGTFASVQEGVAAGEAVVIEGLDRLREGRKVIVVNEAAVASGP